MPHNQPLPIYDNGPPPPLPARPGIKLSASQFTTSDNISGPPPLPARPKNVPLAFKKNNANPPKLPFKGIPHIYPPPPPPKLPPRNAIFIVLDEETELQRTNVVRELIENEKLFHRQMSYVSEILSNGQIPVPITGEDLAAIKANLNDYVSSSEDIIKAYETAVCKAPEKKLSHACVAMHLMQCLPKFCKVVIDYIKEFDPQILEHRPQLKNYFSKADELLQKKEGTMTTLLDRLFKLFQRPFQIKCLLSRLRKFTPKNHPDYVFVVAADAAIQKACDDADACKRKDAEYISTVAYEESPEVDATDNLEDTRMVYYRKKRRKLSLLLDDLCKWIETHSKDLKSLIEDRRCLIKASHGLVVSLDEVKSISGLLDFHSTMISHGIEKFNPGKFDKSTHLVLDRLNSVNIPLKKLKSPMKKLKGRAKDIERMKKVKINITSAINKYRADESRAMTTSEKILGQAEKVIRTLFLLYLYNVHELMLFFAINPDGIMDRYVKGSGWINKSEVKKRIEQDIEAWRTRIKLVLPAMSINMDKLCGVPINNDTGRYNIQKMKHPQKPISNISYDIAAAIERAVGENDHSTSATPQKPTCPARVTFSYWDKQTSVHLRPGDTVNVIKWADDLGNSEWADDLGNSEWALIRAGKSSEFYYPSNRLQPIG
ncbi:unnamed protein product [Hymenolepis diminuta]|uniref:DH domain-containing protein n=2 Tax=Hymenolepis diminuta TaxID=6216 RepID=A0A564YNG1_HYMDI|nr:unnamed protein product [Hymenolepis diminuta]